MAYRDTVLGDSPVAYWRLGEASGTTAQDETANNRDGTYNGGVTLGAVGVLANDADTAASFDGVDDYVNIAHNALYNRGTALSVEAWFKPTEDATFDPAVVSKRDAGLNKSEWGMGQAGDGKLIAGFWNPDASAWDAMVKSINNYAAGTWYHIVMTWDGTTLRFYVDGVEQGTSTSAGTYVASDTPVAIARTNDGMQYVAATIDEVAIYDSTLTATQVENHYQVGTGAGVTYTATPMTASADIVHPTWSPKTQTIVANADTYDSDDNPGSNNDTSTTLLASTSAQERIYIKFDSLDTTDINVESAVIRLTVAENVASVGYTVVANSIDETWDSSTLTHNTSPSLIGAYSDSTSTPSAGLGAVVEIDVSNIVQGWLDGHANNGIRLHRSDAGFTDRFASIENTTYDEPTLVAKTNSNVHTSYTATPATASADNVDPAVSTGITHVATPATADADALHPAIRVTPMTASAAAVDPVVGASDSTSYKPAVFTASADMPDAGTNMINYLAVPMTADGDLVEPSMDVSFTTTPATANADITDASVVTYIGADPMTAHAEWVETLDALDWVIRQAQLPRFWYKFDELSGATANNYGTDSQDGTYYGDPNQNQEAPLSRRAVRFDGQDDYIQFYEGSITGQDEVTVEIAFRTTDRDTSILWGGEGAFLKLVDGKPEVKSPFTNKRYIGMTDVADGEWHFLVIRAQSLPAGASGRELHMWVDGKRDIERTEFHDNWYQIGGRIGSDYFTGEMAYFAQWSSVLSEPLINRHYQGWIGTFPYNAKTAKASASMPEVSVHTNIKKMLALYFKTGFHTTHYQDKKITPDMHFSRLIAPKGYNPQSDDDFFQHRWNDGEIQVTVMPWGGYYDYRTDTNSRLIDFDEDVDMDEYDLFTFVDMPNFSDLNPAQRTRVEDFLRYNVRDALDKYEVSMIIFEPEQAKLMGFIETYQQHWCESEGRYDAYPMENLPLDPPGQKSVGVDGEPPPYKEYARAYSFHITHAGQFYDLHYLNSARVVNEVTDYTDLRDIRWHPRRRFWAQDRWDRKYPIRKAWDLVYEGDSPPLTTEDVERQAVPLREGEEVLLNPWRFYSTQGSTFYPRLAYLTGVPDERHVGTPVLKGQEQYFHGGEWRESPTKDWTFAFVVEKGTVVDGRPLNARVYVDFNLETVTSTAGGIKAADTKYIWHNNTPYPEYWVGAEATYPPDGWSEKDYVYPLSPQGDNEFYMRSYTDVLEMGRDVHEWDYDTARNVLHKGGQSVLIWLDQVQFEKYLLNEQKWLQPEAKHMKNYPMLYRGVNWLKSDMLEPGEVRVRPGAMKADSTMNDVSVYREYSETVPATPLRATAKMEDTYSEDVQHLAFPMEASVRAQHPVKVWTVDVLEGSADMVEATVRTEIDAPVLYVYDPEPVLHLV